MIKEELIENIKNIDAVESFMSEIIWVKRNDVLALAYQLDEPEKPVVPQFVADWYEDNKGDLEFYIYDLCADYRNNKLEDNELREWFGNDSRTKPIETLMKMKFYGYEVEKEKLYKVSLKKNGIGIGVQQQDGSFKEQFAKEELKEYGFDNLDEYEVEEVEE